MKRTIQAALLAGGCLFLTACEAAADLPSCQDGRTQKGARSAIENSYRSAGFSGSSGKPFIAKLPNLVEQHDEETARDAKSMLKLRSVNDLRICRAELYKDAYVVVMIARNPDAPNEFGYAAYNIGLPNHALVGEGWLR